MSKANEKQKSKVREKVLSLLDKGMSTEKIMSKVPECTKQQIAGYKAWVTMGKY
jgi:uncharacterized protein (DUF433 family)